MKTRIMPLLTAAAMAFSLGMTALAEGEDQTTVAKIGDKTYAALQTAVYAASSGTEIDLVTNSKEDITINSDDEVTIDLNGHTLTNSQSHTITNNGKLTVIDSSDSKNGKVDNITHGKAAVYNTGTATILGGTYERSQENSSDNSYYTIENQGDMTIGSDESTEPDVIVNNSGKLSSNIRNGGTESATLTIKNAEVTGGINSVKNDEYGKLTVNGGTFNISETGLGSVIMNGNEACINSGIFTASGEQFKTAYVVRNASDAVAPKMEIRGGSFISGENASIMPIVSGSLKVYGGKFSETFASGAMGEDRIMVKDEDGTYTVESNTDANAFAAKSRTVYYSTINAAIKDAIDNQSIGSTGVTLLRDVEEDVVIPSTKKIQLYLDGHTITNVSNDTISNYGTLTITQSSTTDGGIVDNRTHEKAALRNYPGATANLNNGVTLMRSEEKGTAEGNNGNSYYTVVNQGIMNIGLAKPVDGRDPVKIENKGSYSSTVENGWQDSSEITEDTAAKLTINYAKIYGGINAVKNDECGKLVINNGEFVNSANEGAVIQNWNIAEINDGVFNGQGKAVLSNGTWNDNAIGELYIKGGIFEASSNTVMIGMGEGATSLGNISISGGAYTTDVTDYLAEGSGIGKIDNNFVVISPDSPASKDGTYKTEVEDGTYEQMTLFTKTFEAGSPGQLSDIGFKITEGDKSYEYNYQSDTTIAEGTVMFGLIVTDIPENTELTIELK